MSLFTMYGAFFNVVKGLKSGGTRQWKEGYALSLQLHLLHFYLTNLLVSPPAVDSLYFHSSASVITFVLKKKFLSWSRGAV